MKLFKKFRTKFLFMTASSVIIVIFLSYFLETTIVMQYIKEDSKGELKKNAGFINHEIGKLKNDLWTEGLITVEQEMGKNGDNIIDRDNRFKWILNKLADNFQDLETAIYDPNLVLVDKTKGFIEESVEKNLSYTNIAQSDEELIEPEIFFTGDNMYVRAIVKIKRDYKTIAFLIMNNKISESYIKSLKRSFLGKDTGKYFVGEISIFDMRGKSVASTDKSMNMRKNQIKGDEFFIENPLSIEYFRYFPENKIWIKVSYPVSKLRNIIFQKNIFIMNFILIVFLSVIMHFIIKNITNPINKIIGGIGEVKRGNLNYKIEYKGEDDLESAVESYNEMTEVLKRNKEIEERYSSLDKIASVGRLAAGIAHEVKNPLASLQLIANMYYESFERIEFKREDFLVMSKEIKRINGILENLLEFAKGTNTEIKENNIVTAIKEMVNLTSKSAKTEGNRIDFISESDEICILCDINMIKQMLLNLLINSIEASENEVIEVSIRRENEVIFIAVKDRGRGMDETVLKKAMEPFYTTKTKGTGIGLSIVKKIIDIHNFKYRIESEKGKGTQFTIIIDLTKNRELRREENYKEEEILDRREL